MRTNFVGDEKKRKIPAFFVDDSSGAKHDVENGECAPTH